MQRLVEFGQHPAGIGEILQRSPRQQDIFLPLPAFLADQIVVERAIFVGMLEVQRAGLQGPGDMGEQKGLVERDPCNVAVTHDSRALGRLEELMRRRSPDRAILGLEVLDGGEQPGCRRLTLENQSPDDRANPVLQLEGTAFENVVVVVVAPPGVELPAQGDHGRGLVVVVRGQQVADLTDLLGVGEGRIVDDLLDLPQHQHDRGIDGIEQTGQLIIAPVTPCIAAIFMLTLAGVLVRLQGGQQRISTLAALTISAAAASSIMTGSGGR